MVPALSLGAGLIPRELMHIWQGPMPGPRGPGAAPRCRGLSDGAPSCLRKVGVWPMSVSLGGHEEVILSYSTVWSRNKNFF
jgi:hypothetical protein